MPDFGNTGENVRSGIATGMAIPNRASGMADVIKAITNDLKVAASSRADTMAEAQKQRSETLNHLIDKGYRFKPGVGIDDFLRTGNVELFTTPGQGSAGGMLGGQGGPGMRVKGVSVNAQGEATTSYEPNVVSPDKAGLAALANESIGNIQGVKDVLFPKGTASSYRRDIATGSNLPMNAFPLIGAAIPSNVGFKNPQTVFRKMSAALSGRQLIQTGVAARPEETAKLVSQFAPSGLMSSQAALDGLNELQKFYNEFLSALTTGQIDWAPGKGIVQPGQGVMAQGAKPQDVMNYVQQNSDQGASGMLGGQQGNVVEMEDANGNRALVDRSTGKVIKEL